VSITLTGKEIMDLAEFAGFEFSERTRGDAHLEEMQETEYVVTDCPVQGVALDEQSTDRHHYPHIAYLAEYPEEGVQPLGEVRS